MRQRKEVVLKLVLKKDILITNFDEESLGPSTLDLKIEDKIFLFEPKTEINLKTSNTENEKKYLSHGRYSKEYSELYREIKIPDEGLLLLPNQFYLAHSVEKIYSEKYFGLISGRSSWARLGLDSHRGNTILFLDEYTKNYGVRMQITCMHRIRLYKGDKICQIAFIKK